MYDFTPLRNCVYDTIISGFNQLVTLDSEDDDMVDGGRGAAVRIARMRIYSLVIKPGREGEIKATTVSDGIDRGERNNEDRRKCHQKKTESDHRLACMSSNDDQSRTDC